VIDLHSPGVPGGSLIDIAVLISGSGTNLQALIDAERAGDLGARIAVVVSDRADAGGLHRARDAGIATEVISWGRDRDTSTAALCDLVSACGAELMVLAGFMRILGPEAVRRFPDRIVNIHPSLLPSFPGAHAVEQALEFGSKVTGVTVHLVDEEVDHGPVISQEAVPVLDGDDADSLHRRIQEAEHRLFPEAVAAIAQGRISVSGRKVVWA
jgi:phosphoribosylglycinamide formyltransferase 1